MAGVIRSCSPLVNTSLSDDGTSPVRWTASARYCRATKGTIRRSTCFSRMVRRSLVLFSRSSSSMSTNVPPCANVVKIS